MLESISSKVQYNRKSKRLFQDSERRHLDIRSAFMSCIAAVLLIAASPHSNAEDTPNASLELGKSGQLNTDGQNQTAETKTAKPKIKCMPKKPCPETEKPE